MLGFPEVRTAADYDPAKQIESFLGASSFPTNQAELLLLSKFTFPTEPTAPTPKEAWRKVLNDEPENIIARFLSDKFLEQAKLDFVVLLQSKSSNELKLLAKERGIPHSGTKETLANRLVTADPVGMARLFSGKAFLICSTKGRVLIEKFLEADSYEKERAELESIKALKEERWKDACLVVATYESSRVFGRGVGMDWRNYVPTHDLSVLDTIFNAHLPRHSDLDQKTMMSIRVSAAMMHLWGTNQAPRFLRDGIPDIGRDFSIEARMLLFHALGRASVQGMKDAGILRVKMLPSGNSSDCPICQSDANKIYSIDVAPVLPHEGCTCESGCKCIAIATE